MRQLQPFPGRQIVTLSSQYQLQFSTTIDTWVWLISLIKWFWSIHLWQNSEMPKKLFFYLLDLSTVNVYILYCKQKKKVKHLHFVEQIMQHCSESSNLFVWSLVLPGISQSLFQQLNESRNKDENALFASLTEKEQASDG